MAYVPPALYAYVAPATVRAADFLASLGVNTHISFGVEYDGPGSAAVPAYTDLGKVAASINYLGVKNLRDSAANSGDQARWASVTKATGAQFDAYIGETSVQGMGDGLALLPPFGAAGLLNAIEGGNEEDDSYPASLGNSTGAAAAFQSQMWTMGQAMHMPVINMSFGAGWTSANNWHGDYDKVGDLSGAANYGNAHTYPNAPDGAPDSATLYLDSLAKMAAATRPVFTTEIGWDENQGFNQAQNAKLTLNAAFDGMKDGNPRTYFYALYDDGSGKFGLMNADGSAKPAGSALHNLTAILADSGKTAGTFTTGALSYTLSGMASTDYGMMLEKSDGTHWLALWGGENQAAASPHTVAVNLAAAAPTSVFDPLSGTAAIQASASQSVVAVSLLDHPVLVQIGTTAKPAPTPTPAPAPAPAPVPTPAPAPVPSPSVGPNPVILYNPGSPKVVPVPVAGVLLSDPWAAGNAGKAGLFLSTSAGTLYATYGGKALSAVPGGQIAVSDTLANLNAALATLALSANPGTVNVTVDFWDQAGIEARKTIAVTVQ